MDRESVDRLRFDRRLERRRGWVEDADRQSHLESLPDVTDKMTRGLDEPDESTAADATQDAPARSGFGPTPSATDTPAPFGAPSPAPASPSFGAPAGGDQDPS